MKSTLSFSFSIDQIEKLYPFYLLLDNSLTIVGHGNTLRKFNPKLNGTIINDNFLILRPKVNQFDWNFLKEHQGRLFILELKGAQPLILRGEWQHLVDEDLMIFCCFPWLNSLQHLNDLQLTYDELGTLDPSKDYLNLIRTHEITTEDTLNIIDIYKKRKNELTRLSLVAAETKDAVVIVNAEGYVEWANKGFENLYGYTNQLSLNREAFFWLQPLKEVEKFKEDLFHQRIFQYDLVSYHVNGNPHWVRISSQPIFDDENQLIFTFIREEDISATKNAEEALKHNQQIWEYALESTGDGVWKLAVTDGKIEYDFSETYKVLLGYSRGDAFCFDDWLKHVIEEEVEASTNLLKSLSPEQPYFSYTYNATNKNGKPLQILARGKVYAWHNGSIAQMIGTATDISVFVELEQKANTVAKRLSSLIENLQSGILLEDEQRKIVLVNQEFNNLFEIPVPPEFLIGVDCAESANQTKLLFADPERFIERVDELLFHKDLCKDEILEMADGRTFSRDYIPIVNNGKYMGHMWQYTDITDKVTMEKTLEKQRLFYEKILNEIPADIAIFSPDHRYLFLNKGAIQNEETRQWIIGKDDFEFCAYKGIDEQLAIHRRKFFNSVIEKKSAIQFIDEHKKGNSLRYKLRIYYPLVVDDKVELVIGYGVDITELKEQESALGIQRARMQGLLNVINDGIFRCDREGNISYWNAAFLHLMPFNILEKESINLSDIVCKDDFKDLIEKIQTIQNKNDSVSGIFRMYEKDTTNIRFFNYFFALLEGSNEDYELVGRISDVTDRELREQHLSEVLDKEKELSDLKTRFIRITSHELRTPLSVILSNAEILDLLLNKEQADQNGVNRFSKYISRITKEVSRMTDILSELIIVSRLEEGKEAFHLKEDDLYQYVKSIIHDQFSPYLDGRTLECHWDQTITKAWFCKRMLRHAIINLISNAFKFSSGKRNPELRFFNDENNMYIEIKDFGIGIPSSDMKNIFQSFYRGSNVGNISGTGMGLMLTDFIIQSHRGKIDVKSEIGNGTTILIALHIHPQDITE